MLIIWRLRYLGCTPIHGVETQAEACSLFGLKRKLKLAPGLRVTPIPGGQGCFFISSSWRRYSLAVR